MVMTRIYITSVTFVQADMFSTMSLDYILLVAGGIVLKNNQRLRAIDMYKFSSDLEDSMLIRSPLNDDLSLAFDQFNSTLQSMIDNHAPIIRRSVTLRPYAPWFTDKIKVTKRKRRKLLSFRRLRAIDMY